MCGGVSNKSVRPRLCRQNASGQARQANMRQHGRGPFPIPFPISPSQPRCFDAARNTAIGRYDQSRLGGMCLCVCLLVCACSCVRVSVCVLVRACLCARLCVCKRAAAAAIGGRLLGIRSSAVHVPLYLSSVPTRTAEPQSSSGAGAGAHHFSASSPIFLRSPSPRAVPLARNHRPLAPSPALFPRRNPSVFHPCGPPATQTRDPARCKHPPPQAPPAPVNLHTAARRAWLFFQRQTRLRASQRYHKARDPPPSTLLSVCNLRLPP